MSSVVVVNYGLCNLDSIARAVEECGGKARISDDPRDLRTATQIILPGVGAFPDGRRNLGARSLDAELQEQVLGRGVPFLGICLGMQLMAELGHEGETVEGLGWISGEVIRLEPKGDDRRIPHIGWNNIELTRESPLFKGIPADRDFYFVHSYHLRCRDEEQVVARTPYAGGFVSSVCRDNVFGVQFHPEKSQKAGFQVLRNFLAI
jgi:imidazole glycerol-phosphate synthase subunit HisH